MKFYCESCGEEVTPDEGTLSWADAGKSLRDFRITHKKDQNHRCDPEDVGYVHLWIMTGLTGYMKFTEILTDYWAKGYAMDDSKGLKRALNQIGKYIWEESKQKSCPPDGQ